MTRDRSLAGRKILVTGGAGFVGSVLVRRLLTAGSQVTVLDDLFTGRRDSIPEGVEFIEGSVTDAALVNEVVKGHTLIFHLAARNIIASTANPRDDFATNIGGTLNVLLAAREAGVERVVYTSSASVYGNPRSIPINEEDGLATLSPYSVSKLAGENYCLAFYESYGLPVSVVRYSNVFGPFQTPENPYCGVVSKFLIAVYAGRPLAIHGDGGQTRDFTFVEDAVEATVLVATHPRAEGEVFNVGTGIETSVNDLADAIGRVTGRPVVRQQIDRRDVDNIRRRVVNIEKIRRMLRWSPQVTLDRGLEQTVRWFEQAGLLDAAESISSGPAGTIVESGSAGSRTARR